MSSLRSFFFNGTVGSQYDQLNVIPTFSRYLFNGRQASGVEAEGGLVLQEGSSIEAKTIVWVMNICIA